MVCPILHRAAIIMETEIYTKHVISHLPIGIFAARTMSASSDPPASSGIRNVP